MYVAREYAPLPDRLRAYTRYARSIPVAAGQIQANLRTPLPRTYVQIGHTVFGGLASFYEKDVPGIFAAVSDAQLQAEFRAANAGAIKAMKDLDAWFTQQEAGATDTFSLGADKFAEMLRATERVDVPLTQLKAVAERDLQRNLAALREACANYAGGQTIAACIAKMQANKEPGAPVDAARIQLAGLKAFVETKRLVSIPGPEQAEGGGVSALRALEHRADQDIRDPTKRTCRRSTRSRRRTRSGPRRSGRPISPEVPISCLSPHTRSGPATSCNSCTQGDHRPSWVRSL